MICTPYLLKCIELSTPLAFSLAYLAVLAQAMTLSMTLVKHAGSATIGLTDSCAKASALAFNRNRIAVPKVRVEWFA